MSSPLVSIVLPTRNRRGLLREALASIRAQSYRDLEILVVDDGSTDETPRFLAELDCHEPRLRILRNERSLGAAAARNRALEVAQGKYIAFQDDDCYWAPEKIERQLRVLEGRGPDVGFVYGPMESTELDGARRMHGVYFPREKYRGAWSAGTPAVVARRDLILEVGGFDERLPRLQDFDLWLRLLSRTDFAYVPEVLVRTQRIAGGISTQESALLRAIELLTRKYRKEGCLSAQDRAEFHQKLGHRLIVDGFWMKGTRQFASALATRPFNPRHWMAIGAALTGCEGYRLTARVAERVNWRGANAVRRSSTREGAMRVEGEL